MARVLVVDDDRSIRRTLEKLLTSQGYAVSTAATGPEAVATMRDSDVMLLDLGLPGMDGMEVLERAMGDEVHPAVVVITARDDMQSTVRAIQLGAYDYLVKPLDVALLDATVRRAIESRDAIDNARRLSDSDEPRADAKRTLVGKSAAVRTLYKTIGAVSTTRASVLVTGESGTGKELVARAIHDASASRGEPFVAINCTAFAHGLLESELFGHVRGAFTGAVADKPGRFELAGAGTLMLDEIGEIPLDLQAKLLRVLQERTFERVGSARPMPLAARIVAATHRDLASMVRDGTFREDLYWRLKVVEVHIPPLRERREDIPLLVETLLARIAVELHKRGRFVADDALALMLRYDWPGNVRELENALTRAVVLAKGEVLEAALLPIAAAASGSDGGDSERTAGPGEGDPPTLRDVERAHVERVLAHTGWNKRRACALLDISRPTLDRKIEEFRLRKPDET
ncbi:MAG: sigma-54-dependent Fis family transcriptional regulator [Deltaproteobacteria bacterium]|nr:sigma-54-dependent Fis family transcriptional regulator [Deltaproteobacteria bacterium]